MLGGKADFRSVQGREAGSRGPGAPQTDAGRSFGSVDDPAATARMRRMLEEFRAEFASQ